MNTSDKIEQVSASLFAVHRDLKNPRKDSKADAGKFAYTYLSLPALIEHLRPYLKDAQLFVTQEDLEASGGVRVMTTVWHLSGQYIEFGPAFIAVVGDEQKQGGAKTYARRYALAAVFNLAADEDTDAAVKPSASVGRGGPHPSQVTPPAPKRSAPDPLGEGGEGAEPLATQAQWANLLALTSGKTGEAVKLLNEKLGTDYTYRSAKEGATQAELAAVLP